MSAISPPLCKICHRAHWLRDGCSGRPFIPEAHELLAPKKKKKRKAKA